jgi:hypothetical protein
MNLLLTGGQCELVMHEAAPLGIAVLTPDDASTITMPNAEKCGKATGTTMRSKCHGKKAKNVW